MKILKALATATLSGLLACSALAMVEVHGVKFEDSADVRGAKLPAADRKPQLPGIIMAAIYRTLLEEIRTDGCRVLTHRTSLPPARKLWIAFKTWIRG
jgi:phytoene synthase